MPRSRPILTAVATTAALALLSGCGDGPAEPAADESNAGFLVTVDNCGEEVTFDEPVRSVMTIGTSAVWNIHTAGAGDRIVARAGEFGAPLGTDELTDFFTDVPVIDPSDPTAEAVVGTGAELVIGYGLFNTSKEALADLGIETLENLGDCGHDPASVAEGFTVDMVLDDIERFGQVFGTEAVAEENLAELRAGLEELDAQRPAETSTALILSYFGGQLGSHGGANVSTDVLERAGLENVFADQADLYLEPSLETIVDSDPDYLVVHYGVEGEPFEQARDAILAADGMADLRAVRNGNVIGVPYDGLTATPGAVDGIRTLIEGQTGGPST